MATLVYDAEVFPHNWMIGFKEIETGKYFQIWDDFDEIIKFIKDRRSDFYIGFNSNFYDDNILEAVLKRQNPYKVSCDLIDNGVKMHSRLKLNRMDIREGMAMGTSLKTIESEIGMSIEESLIDFNIDRPLTEEEIDLTNLYNKHDLDATHQLLQYRWSNFVKTKMDLIKYFNLDPSMMNKPFATMVATGLGAKRTNHPPRKFQWYDTLQIANQEIVNFIKNEKFLTENLIFDIDGVSHKIGLGGIHAARENYQSDNFWIIDVKGYYSLIQMNLDLLSRSLPPEGKAKYKQLYDDRLIRKNAGDPSADSLKAAVLAVWGATLNQYQLLADVTTGNLIMITGQAYLIDLLEKLEPYVTLIQSNTDGIFVEPHDEEKVMEITNEWVARTGFEVEIEKGSKLYQKDVNNYVCLIDGKKIVAKGSYVNMYQMQDDRKFFEFKLTYNQSQGTIIDKALVNYFIYDIPVEETINKEENMRSFMFTLKKGARTYSHVEIHSTDKTVENAETVIERALNTNRVFASKDESVDRRIYKIKDGKPNKYPNLDVNIFIFNKDLSEFTEEDMNRIDREYYITRAKERINDYLEVKPEKVKKVKETKINLRVAKGEYDESEYNNLVDHILSLTNGIHRVGNITVNVMGDWFTFTDMKGKTSVLNRSKITVDVFDIKEAKLRNKKIIVQRGKKYFHVEELTFNTRVSYEDKKDESENFELFFDTYEEAFEQLIELELADEDMVEIPEEKEVARSTGRSKEVIHIDEHNMIVYESFNMGDGVEWEVVWVEEGVNKKYFGALTIDAILDKIEEWLKELE